MTKIPIHDYIKQSSLPRSIYKSTAPNFIGKEILLFCNNCKARMMSVIDESGIVSCPNCGMTPKGKNISLAITERRKLITELFAKDKDLDQYVSNSMERYCQGIDNMGSGMLSKTGAKQFYDYYANEFAALDDCALYYLKSPDQPDSSVHSESGLKRMDYREDRKINCVHYYAFKSQAADEEKSLSDLVETMAYSFREENFAQYYDPNFSIKEFTEPLTDLTEKKIVYLLYMGYSKKEIQSILNVSESQLRTIISHIAKKLKAPLLKDDRIKECSRCHQAKISSDFGNDSRNSDGLKSWCKACESSRKKEKRLHDISTK